MCGELQRRCIDQLSRLYLIRSGVLVSTNKDNYIRIMGRANFSHNFTTLLEAE